MADKDFEINEFGEVLRNSMGNRVEDDALWNEYHQLEYEIFSHNDKSPEKLKRFEELKKQLGVKDDVKKNAFLKAKEKIKAETQKTMSVSELLAMRNSIQNE